jgi:hypothetical protein
MNIEQRSTGVEKNGTGSWHFGIDGIEVWFVISTARGIPGKSSI